MSRRVHFSSTNRVYSPIPKTPSPCSATSSLPSSPDITTPPPELESMPSADVAHYPRSPYPHTHDQLLLFPDLEIDKEMHVHAFLAYDPYSDPEVPYDLSFPANPEHYPPFALQEPATQPPLPALTIICPDFLPWEIPVKTSGIYVDSVVTVEDVLTAVYLNLRLAVAPNEYAALGPAKPAVDAAYFDRVMRKAHPKQKEQEAAKGVKRVDFLRGRTAFKGLSVSPRGSDVWELNVS